MEKNEKHLYIQTVIIKHFVVMIKVFSCRTMYFKWCNLCYVTYYILDIHCVQSLLSPL